MFCSSCGAQIPDNSTFCPKCGAAQLSQPAPTPEPAPAPVQPAPVQPEPVQPAPSPQTLNYDQSAYQQQTYQQQTYQQQTYQQQTYQQAPSYQAAPQPMSLKDIKIDMPASVGDLFVGYNKTAVQYAESTGLKMKWYKALVIALLYIGAFVNLMSGFGCLSEGINGVSAFGYPVSSAVRGLDILNGLIYFGFALASLYVRMRLAQFKTDGPQLYLYLLLANVVIGAVFSLLSGIATRSFDSLTLCSTIATGLAMFVLNRTYFGKRQHLFTM